MCVCVFLVLCFVAAAVVCACVCIDLHDGGHVVRVCVPRAVLRGSGHGVRACVHRSPRRRPCCARVCIELISAMAAMLCACVCIELIFTAAAMLCVFVCLVLCFVSTTKSGVCAHRVDLHDGGHAVCGGLWVALVTAARISGASSRSRSLLQPG
ncbi:hypothetical protein MTO96_016498 [Rhipicephalus appendiculatus]